MFCFLGMQTYAIFLGIKGSYRFAKKLEDVCFGNNP